MFRRILIANRGEIACRIIATARRMGIATVAVHSAADAGARHVALADAAVAIGGAAPADSYLSIPRLIAAAREAGAEAVHPGYGFLSENAAFAEACRDAGLAFVGPSPQAIRAMGLKDAAKRRMAAAGVPVLPGFDADQDPAALAAAAAAIGWPVAVKAVAGGGGRGLRRVADAAGFAPALAAARAEARAAFGDDRVLVERWIERPRHIEVQVLGDGRSAIHLFERDCSLQRRHQKVIEEAPAPGMTAEMRAAMGAAAVRAAEAIAYAGAGTVEFIVDAAGGLRPDAFWFMEMNTRLQVEHPVTEAVTGIDLVEWQLRIAAGQPLLLRQADVRLDGHAVEARLCAEDAAAGFLPSTGRIAHLRWPAGLRVDTGVAEGDTVTPHYDSLLAKLVAHAPTRAAAFARLADGLAATEIAGPATNLGALARLAAHPEVLAGRVDTGLIGRELAALAPPPPGALVAAGLLAAAGLADGPLAGFALWQPLARPVRAEAGWVAGGETVEGRVALSAPDRAEVEFDGIGYAGERRDGLWQVAGAPRVRRVVEAGDLVHLVCDGWPGGLTLRRPDPLARRAAAAAAGDVVLAPMPGVLRRVAVRAGDAVTAGQAVAVLEAMKMEHALAAPRDGVVAEVAAEGAQLAAGAAVLRLEPAA
jgi:3-methylcrotonyl-CoA carboxylase alpha subunit